MERKHMRFLTLLVSLLMLVSLCTATVFAAETDAKDPVCYYHGDVNGDGAISKSDALYVLYYSILGDLYPDRYPLTQDFDFSADDKVSKADALYLLYAATFGDPDLKEGSEDCPLNGLIHDYYDPYWDWSMGAEAASLTFVCGCGEKTVLDADDGVVVTNEITAATCVADGKIVYTATITYEEKEYTGTYTEAILSTGEGHHISGAQTCTTGVECALCDYSLPALGHNWVLSEELSTAATCTNKGVQYYVCANGCDEQYTVETETVPHTHSFTSSTDVLKEGTTCTYITTSTYTCTCGDQITKETEYYQHTYKAVVTQEATCNAAGIKSYVCESCGTENDKIEAIPVNAEAHSWNEGELDEVTGITTYTCSVCNGTKTVVTVAKDETVSKDQLSNELQLENANVSLDEKTVAELDEDKQIKISVSEADLNNTNLSDEQKEQVGDNTVYDFSMTYDDGTPITEFAGKVKVSLPYTLTEGEDIDSIDIWYIDDTGIPTQMTGTYANGYVTFETDHFSYYTVTRLTPAERCERYGHIWIDVEKLPTCSEEGYTKQVCQRCASVQNENKMDALGHAPVDGSDAKDATCSEPGMKHQTCERCDYVIREEIPALGHNLVDDEEGSQKADCYNPGKQAKHCDRPGCDHKSVEELPQLKHDFGENEKETLYPDCTSGGHDHQKCNLCNQDIISNETNPLGHDYTVESWNWNEDKTAVTVKLICKVNPEHTKELNAVVSVKTESATCTGAGYVIYTGTVFHNGAEFTESAMVEVSALGHQGTGEWQITDSKHYQICSVCGEKTDMVDHDFDINVIKEPTCSEEGLAEGTCTICGFYATDTITATGEHNLVDGKCVDCGFNTETCNHMRTIQREFDLSEYGICDDANIDLYSCECGENQQFYFTESHCQWTDVYFETKTLPNGMTIEVNTVACTECGLVYQGCGDFTTIDEESCVGYWSSYNCLSMNGQTILECVYVSRSAAMAWDHPVHKVTETIDVTTLGMCDGKLIVEECSCGIATHAYFEDLQCDLVTGDEGQTCSVCGVSIVGEYLGTTEDGCAMIDKESYTIQKNGQDLYTYYYTYTWNNHIYRIVDYKLYGSTCEDGILVDYKCKVCDAESSSYWSWHVGVITEKVADLTGYGSCADEVYQSTCACGAETYGYEYSEGETHHDWTRVSYDEETETSVSVCSICGYTETRVITRSEKDANCNSRVCETFTYTDDKGHVYSYTYEYDTVNHNYKTEYILNGTSCDDGGQVINTCTDCGYSYIRQTFTTHQLFEQVAYEMSDYGLCGGYTVVYGCPCGTYQYIQGADNCYWQYLESTNKNGVYYEKLICYSCGVTREYQDEVLAAIDDCHNKTKSSYTYSKDGQELLEVSAISSTSNHRYVYTYDLYDETKGCDGGYDIFGVCLTCGETYARTGWYGHRYYPVARDVVSENQLCGDLEMVTYSCACGGEIWVDRQWSDGSCNFYWNSNKNCQVCVDCGATYKETGKYTAIEGETCKSRYVTNILITKNGKTVCDFNYDYITTKHTEVYNYTLLGNTCDDGWTATVTCADCGEYLRAYENTRYGCSNNTVEVVKIASVEGVCDDIIARINSCACGKVQGVWEYWDCDFNWIGWDDATDSEKWQCSSCGLIWYRNSNREHISGTCTANETYNFKYELDGETVGSFSGTYVVEDHNKVATFNLWGETCDEGFDITYTCVYCGESESWTSYGCSWWETGYYNLADYGMCGGEIWTHGCACGKENGWGWNGDACSWEHKNYDETTSTSTYYCSDCKTYYYRTRVGQHDSETCTYTGTETRTYVRDGETLLSISMNENYESHDTFATEATLLNPEGSCDDGVVVTEQCRDCGYERTQIYYWHYTMETLTVDLSDGCGGQLRFGNCACGENQFFSREHECQGMIYEDTGKYDENGIYHHGYQETCSDCDLSIQRDYYYIHSGCQETRYDFYTVTYKGQTYVYDNSDTYESHDPIYVDGGLKSGSETCEDGGWASWVCADCGATGSSTFAHHLMIRQDSIDLAQYGSYCGATLDLYRCACGQYQRYDIGEESECDVGNQYCSHFIDGVIDTWQMTTQGGVGTYSDSYLLKCAVSDPVACGMTIRMSEYWLNENCLAVEYQTWQLGYNEEDGTCAKEITIKTGYQHAYHPYEESNTNETLDDGSVVSTSTHTCPDCGSYYYDQWTYLNDIQTKYEAKYVNTRYASNGENRELERYNEYGFVYNGYNYATVEYDGETHADGSLYWYKYVFTDYDFSNNDCKRTATYSDSNGYTSTEIVSAHIVTCRYYNELDPTCSQHGKRVHAHDCVVCGVVDWEERYPINPTCHYWSWNSEKSIYICTTCGLESAVGSTGSICLEDLTEDEDTDYLVGYWNRDSIAFTPVVSVILDDVTDDNELVLSNIEFNYLTVSEDGVRALSFNKEDAHNAALVAMENIGYTGSFAIRISFVPVTGDNTLDYAITFDSLTN